ncbi:MAG: M48 family metallopeptidase [Eggerthellaceae bacterium]|nr:M48 family metallopeptidase [Eggerthellaceae bacterium]
MTPRQSRSAARPTQLIFIDDLEVWLTRKSIKNMHLRVKPPDGRIEVSAPLRLPQRTIERFVREKRDWIQAQQRAIAASPRVEAAEASPEEIAQWKAVVSACVPPLIEAWEPILGVKAGNLAYRNMTSRWGSCQPATGRICINVRLALYPPECLEYVVVHELCHLLERGHGPKFHALMDAVMPDWKQRRAKLR